LTAPVRETSPNTLQKILAFAAAMEVGTGLVLVISPAIVVTLLLGADASGVGTLVGRFFGVSLFALGVACWPAWQRAESASPAFRAMLVYNALIATYLAYLGTAGHLGGLLLWPAVALHAVVALLLAWIWRDNRRIKATNE
jgi:Ca2+/Na+ antiporter